MAAFILLGKYSHDGLKNISADRTKKVNKLVDDLGGKIEAIYAVLGKYDVVLRARFPENREALKASVELGKLTGISFTTLPAVPIEEFDKLVTN